MQKYLFHIAVATLILGIPYMHGAAGPSENPPGYYTESLEDKLLKHINWLFYAGSYGESLETKLLNLFNKIDAYSIIVDIFPYHCHTLSSKETFKDHLLHLYRREYSDHEIDMILPYIAHRYYLHLNGNLDTMPEWLQDSFQGVSIQDLIDYALLPKINSCYDDIQELDLRDLHINDLTGINNIPHIDQVQSLVLSNNRLKTIQPGTFEQLTHLQYLYLERDQLTAILPGTFKGLKNLQQLILSRNELTEITDFAFVGLDNLQRLNLYANKLTSLHDRSFHGIDNLQVLNLINNKLTDVESHAFIDLRQLESLSLSNFEHALPATIRDEILRQLPHMPAENVR